jgi:hypothetical protein
MSTPTITVKLRDTRTTPSPTRTFVLPATRLIHTSAYFREHLASPLSRHRDGIFRLNFPDFELFEIYAEWLSSGEIFTKAGLACLHSPSKSGSKSRLKTKEDLREKARAAYTDYLGAWFLGSWVKDATFKDSLVSLMVEKMENVEGHPREFVKCLTPSLVDVVFAGSRVGDVVRRFVFAAIKNFGTQEDVESFMPDEGGKEYPRVFVRGLMVYLHNVRNGDKEEDQKDDGLIAMNAIGTSSTASITTEASHGMRNGTRARKENVDVEFDKGDTVTKDIEFLSTATFTTVWKSNLPDTSITNSDLTPDATINPDADPQHNLTSMYDSETDITQTATTMTETSSQPTSTSIYDSGSDFTQTATTTTSSHRIPPPFMGPMENMWSPASHVSWPSTVTASKVSSSGYLSQDSSSTEPSSKSKIKHRTLSWPRTVEEQCMFHEHSLTGELCYRDAVV